MNAFIRAIIRDFYKHTYQYLKRELSICILETGGDWTLTLT